MAAAIPPPNLIYLDSESGKHLLHDVRDRSMGQFQPILYNIFQKQTTQAGCGIQSSALVLSANALGKTNSTPLQIKSNLETGSSPPQTSKLVPPYTEVELYERPETSTVSNRNYIAKHGLTLAEVSLILQRHGCDVRTVHVSESTVEQFRNDVTSTLASSNSQTCIIVNFSRGVLLPSSRRSHHSPLAAYHPGTDCVLVLDTGEGIPLYWAKVEDMFRAMNTIDRTSTASRGYCVLAK